MPSHVSPYPARALAPRFASPVPTMAAPLYDAGDGLADFMALSEEKAKEAKKTARNHAIAWAAAVVVLGAAAGAGAGAATSPRGRRGRSAAIGAGIGFGGGVATLLASYAVGASMQSSVKKIATGNGNGA